MTTKKSFRRFSRCTLKAQKPGGEYEEPVCLFKKSHDLYGGILLMGMGGSDLFFDSLSLAVTLTFTYLDTQF